MLLYLLFFYEKSQFSSHSFSTTAFSLNKGAREHSNAVSSQIQLVIREVTSLLETQGIIVSWFIQIQHKVYAICYLISSPRRYLHHKITNTPSVVLSSAIWIRRKKNHNSFVEQISSNSCFITVFFKLHVSIG